VTARSRLSWRVPLVTAVLFALVVGCGARVAPLPFAGQIPDYHDKPRLVVVGDLQRTFFTLCNEQNDPERKRIVEGIKGADAGLLAITGDCVFDGGSDDSWEAFDQLVAPLHGLAAIAAFGNHEYLMGPAHAAAHLFPRFPLDGGRHWFHVDFGPLRIIVLDSNRDEFKPAQWRAQIAWFIDELQNADSDAQVHGVFVMLHHAPYTNSGDPGEDDDVQRDIVPPLLNARKTMALLSGHVHSYQRFLLGNKMFVVSGGGGGPRVKVAIDADRRRPYDLFCGPALRDFHFTVYTLAHDGVEAEVRGLPKGGTTMYSMDRFTMPWPGASL
jgi:Calcineurin-like phosphoesterase